MNSAHFLSQTVRGAPLGDLQVSLLLGVVERPNPGEIARRAAMPQPPSYNFIGNRMTH